MTRRPALLLGTLVLGLAAVYALLRPSRSAQEPATARRPLSCRFSAGEELAFQVRASSSARASETASPQQLDLEGIVAKRKGDPYAQETTWFKIKNRAYTQAEGRWELFQKR